MASGAGSAAELVLSVSDTGIGIPGAMLPRVFDLFTQGEATAHRAQSGLGIGLALARRIVEMHDGRIDARSDGPGTGSEFVLRMPLLDRGMELPRTTAGILRPTHHQRSPGTGRRRQR